MEATQAPATSADDAGVVATALDYFEGWFEGDATRMERALHPELAKRAGGDFVHGTLGTLKAQEMIDATVRTPEGWKIIDALGRWMPGQER
jgi:hypothetical protein